MQFKDKIRLQHMLDAAAQAVAFAEIKNRSDLTDDLMFRLSLVKLIEIIGEAASQVSEETRSQNSSIPWPDIISMRHRLVHGYFDINLDILWQTIHIDLPPLIQELKLVLVDRQN